MKQYIRFSPDPTCNGYHIHYKYDYPTLHFEVYPIYDWTGPNNTSGVCYVDKENQPDTRNDFEEGKCLMKLEGSYCWRGVWEGRLYFPDDEYWSEELAELSDLFTRFIEPWAKELIQKVEGKTYSE
jgi:hypothetical protein